MLTYGSETQALWKQDLQQKYSDEMKFLRRIIKGCCLHDQIRNGDIRAE